MDEFSGMHKAVKQLEEEKRGDKAPPANPGDEPKAPGDNTKELRSIVDRIVRLTEEKQGIQKDIKDILGAAKDAGFSAKAIRIIVKHEMEDADQRAERESVEQQVESLKAALGDFASSPLGEAATSHTRRS